MPCATCDGPDDSGIHDPAEECMSCPEPGRHHPYVETSIGLDALLAILATGLSGDAYMQARSIAVGIDTLRARYEAALRTWKCDACDGSGRYRNKGAKTGFVHVTVECRRCGGTGMHPSARHALRE